MKWRLVNLAVADQAIISGTNFCISILLCRAMDPELFGLYIFGFSVFVMSAGLLYNAISGPVSVVGPKNDLTRWRLYVETGMSLAIVFALALAALLIGVGVLLKVLHRSENASMLFVLSVTLAPMLCYEYARVCWISELRYVTLLGVDAVYAILRLAGVVVMILRYAANPFSVFVLFCGAASVALVLFVGIRKKQGYGIVCVPNGSTVKPIWSYGKWTIADSLPFYFSGQLYIYVVAFMLGNAANGILGACRNLVAPVSIALVATNSFVLPYASRIYQMKGMFHSINALRRFGTLLIGCVVLYLLTININSAAILDIVFGRYGNYYGIVVIFSVALFFNALFKPLDIYLKISNCPNMVFVARLIAASVSVVLTFCLVDWWGVYGAAIAQAGTQLAMLGALAHFSRRTFIKEAALAGHQGTLE